MLCVPQLGSMHKVLRGFMLKCWQEVCVCGGGGGGGGGEVPAGDGWKKEVLVGIEVVAVLSTAGTRH